MRIAPALSSIVVLLMTPLQLLFAQVVKEGEDRADVAPSNWSVGAAAGVRQSLYAGEDSTVRAFPLIGYEGERVYWRGLSLGYHLVRSETFVIDGFVAGRLDAVDADDFGRSELAARGIDRDLLEDRDDGADVGMSASWRGDAGEIELSLRADVTGASEGYEADLGYSYPIRLSSRVMLTPRVGVKFLSEDLANYYYGTLQEEVERGVPLYQPDSTVVPYVGLAAAVPFAEKWRLFGQVAYEALPSEIKDSPLIDEDAGRAGRAFLGVIYSF
ncbi:MipA/OmpV family protein [Steroidobacter sp. S1-65]|uniref:MipA/OmpV family protein n=1 Tax=Steroidobacter gossypii TaxID=2805490 RepID=A0ABS1WY80_9GAMM|nr:MipA/OmpV family protein [Steroidobacter gossypii]MBM0105935.1 MipA/OmpV family protein [Steroidobacter gossypii]